LWIQAGCKVWQKAHNSQYETEGEEQNWKLWSNFKTDSNGIDISKRSNRSKEHKKEPRNRHTNVINLSLTEEQGQYHGERHSFQEMVLEQLDIHTQKAKSRHRPSTLHKNEHKMNPRPKCKM
jgi:hypothetical protein